MKNSILVLLFCFITSSHANEFQYKQLLAEYKGGIIGSLNNCGVNLTTNPKFLWGAGSVSLHPPGKEFLAITAFGNRAVISVTRSGEVYFSPDALNLAGGGDTVYLGRAFKETLFSVFSNIDISDFLNIDIFEIEDENVAIIHVKKRGSNTLLLRATSETLESLGSVNSKFIGYANNQIYSQEPTGNIYSFTSLDDYLNKYNGKYIETTSKTIENIKPFGAGLLTVADGTLYYSQSKKLVYGSGVEVMYPKMQEKINQMITVSGETTYIPVTDGDITVIIPEEVKKQIVLALDDGSIIWGNKKILSPINNEQYEIDLEYAYYLSETRWNPLSFDEFNYQLYNGYRERSSSVKTTFLNYGEKQEYGESFHLGHSDINTSGIVMGFNGLPTTVKIENEKTINGWRNKGEVTGTFSHDYSDSYIGFGNKSRIVANHSCTVVTAVTFKEKITELKYEGSLSQLNAFISYAFDFNLEDSWWVAFNSSDYDTNIQPPFDWKDYTLKNTQKDFMTSITSVLNNQWLQENIVKWYLSACHKLKDAPGNIDNNKYYKLGCPAHITIGDIFVGDDWGRGTITSSEGVFNYNNKLTPQFKFVNGELVWTDEG